ncbi:MAG: hypothetical protein EB167_04905 [Nitrososphaeria archaeon]|nr:hypothetical protein [Nitrososphaeria archaeon]
MKRNDNREGIKGMANPGRYGIERFAYWLMRITGLGLLAYLIGHVYASIGIAALAMMYGLSVLFGE